jgi:ureidoacrylate peracid hydrolase
VPERLDPARTCLLLFDTLNGYLKTPGGVQAEYRPAVANMRRLLDAARAARVMVAYAAGSHRPDGAMAHTPLTDTDNRLQPVGDRDWWRPKVVAGEWSGEIVSELAPRPEDFVVPKYRWSAFAGTYLDSALRVHDVTTIVLAGGATDIGIAATAFSAKDLDYDLVIPRDACTASELDNHAQLMDRIFPRMARVRTTDQVIAMLSARDRAGLRLETEQRAHHREEDG